MPSASGMETTDERVARLKANGQMAAYKALKKSLLAAGMSKKDAVARCVEEFKPHNAVVVNKYAALKEPLPEGAVGVPPAPKAKARDIVQAEGEIQADVDLRADAVWIYQALGTKNVNEAEKPNNGAWNAYQLLLRNPASQITWLNAVVFGGMMPKKGELDVQVKKDSGAVLTVLGELAEIAEEANVRSDNQNGSQPVGS